MMRSHGVSQLPVAKGEMPLSAAEVMGSVSELRLMERAFSDAGTLEAEVGEMLEPAHPTIGVGQSAAHAVERPDASGALLVIDGGRPRAVIGRTDLLNLLSPDRSGADSNDPGATP